MIAAGVTLLMVMVIAGCPGTLQFSAQISLDCLIRISRNTGDHFDPGIRKRRLRTAAQSSADQCPDLVVREKPGQRTVPDPVGSEHFAGYDLSVFNIIHLELLRPSEMLEHIAILIGNRDLHHTVLSSFRYYSEAAFKKPFGF